MQDVIPMLSYENGIASLEWLKQAFGFEENMEIRMVENGRLTHAELIAGIGTIMIATPSPDYESINKHRKHCEQIDKQVRRYRRSQVDVYAKGNESMMVEKTIPILRIFDYNKAIEFYVDWLGFEIVWEHYFEENMPVYMEVVKDGLTLHLSEHHGDATPGAKVFVWCSGLKDYHKILIDKQYKNNRPGFEEAFYDAWCVEVIDPFGNKISFNEKKAEYKRTS